MTVAGGVAVRFLFFGCRCPSVCRGCVSVRLPRLVGKPQPPKTFRARNTFIGIRGLVGPARGLLWIAVRQAIGACDAISILLYDL
ncbi:MAG: hypothetical protein C5S49_04895 [Candidatus Methanogaster sp.]|nr:MAG: hypothetical protein C5S49_04895 [ANME-2 cluster archaeon]